MFFNKYFYSGGIRGQPYHDPDEEDADMRREMGLDGSDDDGGRSRDEHGEGGGEGEERQRKKAALQRMLDSNIPDVEEGKDEDDGDDEDRGESSKLEDLDIAAPGFCVECTDQPASLHCEKCDDDYCEVCFQMQHRRGNRKHHTGAKIQLNEDTEQAIAVKKEEKAIHDAEQEIELSTEAEPVPFAHPSSSSASLPSETADWFKERVKYIPVRLSLTERKRMRLLEAALNVSEYTDKVDIYSYKNKTKRIHTQLQEICAQLSGLLVASDYKAGQKLVVDKVFRDNARFFADTFEIGRRYKILNPEKWRSEYGKLMYLLQDSALPEVEDLLDFSMIKPLKTVYRVLESGGCLDMLGDPLMTTATAEIKSGKRHRRVIERETKMKYKAIEALASKYARKSDTLTEEDIKLCLYSVGDNHSYLAYNRDPIDKMIDYLERYFSPNEGGGGGGGDRSLAISAGRGGARLTHSHQRQYFYCLQSLKLWRTIAHQMFKLWTLSEEDLLDSDHHPYRLMDTGQGLNRVQACPRVGRTMHAILHKVQSEIGQWVGSSVIHLGDHNVPNAAFFMDKYTQVSRIINPIVITCEEIDKLYLNPKIGKFIDASFGGCEKLRLDILQDFFMYAFDGSGSDNFFDAGSCIDGRLTSAWNWCSKLEKKSYCPIFRLAGFTGFDGRFDI